MENTLDETLERMFSILVSDKGIGTYESSDEIMKLLIENGLTVNSENPIDLVVKYIPSNTVDTDYLYTLYDELLDDGKEIVVVQKKEDGFVAGKRVRIVGSNADLNVSLL